MFGLFWGSSNPREIAATQLSDIEERTSQALPAKGKASQSLCQEEKGCPDPPYNGTLSLEHMPDEILEKIISCFFTVTQREESTNTSSVPNLLSKLFWSSDSDEEAKRLKDLKESINSLNAFGKVNRRFNKFVKESQSRALIVKAFIEGLGSIGKDHYCISSSLNLDLEALRNGFDLYVRDEDNGFTEVSDLDKKISEIVTDIFNQGKERFSAPSIRYKVLSPEEREFQLSPRDFQIRVHPQEIEILTPLQSILIRKIEDSGNKTYLRLLAISEILINRLDATFCAYTYPSPCSYYERIRRYFIPLTYYEVSSPNSLDHIRKIEEEDIKRVSTQEIKSAIGSQRLILSFHGGKSYYRVRRIGERCLSGLKGVSRPFSKSGDWQLVLQTAYFVYSEGKLPVYEITFRVCYIVSWFWGWDTCVNVILSLFERGELKNREEIHTFLVDEVIGKWEEGKSKKEILEQIKLPFVKNRHPLLSFTTDRDIINKYESGLSTQGIFRLLQTDLVARSMIRTSTYFWGEECGVVMEKILDELLTIPEKGLFLDGLIFRFLNGESREEILESLGLPLVADIYELVEPYVSDMTESGQNLDKFRLSSFFSCNEDREMLFSMVEESLSVERKKKSGIAKYFSWLHV